MKAILLSLLVLLGTQSSLAQFSAADGQYTGSRNLLTNPGFENSFLGWVRAGTAAYSMETATPIKGKQSFKAIASAQIISFRQYVTNNALLAGSNAQIKFSASNTAPSVAVCVGHNGAALSGDSNCITLATDGVKRDYVIPNKFGSTSTGIDVLSPSTTGTLILDSVELGDRLDVSDVQQARLHGSVRTPPTGSCFWDNATTSMVAFSPVAACPVATATGSVAAPATKIPGFVLKGDAGDYEIYVRGNLSAQAAAADSNRCSYAINDGTSTYDAQRMGSTATGSTGTVHQVPSAFFKYTKTNSSDVTIQIYSQATTGNTCSVGSALVPFVFDIYYYPPANKIFSTDSLGWFIDANIGGANPDLGVANVSTYTEITNAGLDLVVNTAKGSQSAKILCSGTQAPSGLICAGAGVESVGISFVIPKSGQYEVCADFSHSAQTGTAASSTISTIFQLIETPVNAQTIIQEGGDRKNSRVSSIVASTPQSVSSPHKNCAIFNFASTGERAVRLMYEQTGITPASSVIVADRATDAGQRDIHFTVKPAINLERINGSFAQIEDALEEVYVYAHSSSTTVTGTGNTITFATEVVDTLGAFNPATGIFTAPVDGIYTISGTFTSTATSLAATQILALVAVGNGISHTLERVYGNGSSNQWGATGTVSVRLAAGQTARIQGIASVNLTGDNSQPNTWITISRIPTP